MALFIPANSDEPTREVQPKNGENFKLAELYELLDCQTIELVHLSSGKLMVIDEEGKFIYDHVRNVRATWLADFVSPREFVVRMLRLQEQGVNVILTGEINDNEVDYIAGNALICENIEIK
jgi:hypothetical protein